MEALTAAERRVGLPLPDPAVQPESGLANRLACVLVDFVGLDDALLGHVAELGLGVGGFDLLAGV